VPPSDFSQKTYFKRFLAHNLYEIRDRIYETQHPVSISAGRYGICPSDMRNRSGCLVLIHMDIALGKRDTDPFGIELLLDLFRGVKVK
jgi:hypothetical protein